MASRQVQIKYNGKIDDVLATSRDPVKTAYSCLQYLREYITFDSYGNCTAPIPHKPIDEYLTITANSCEKPNLFPGKASSDSLDAQERSQRTLITDEEFALLAKGLEAIRIRVVQERSGKRRAPSKKLKTLSTGLENGHRLALMKLYSGEINLPEFETNIVNLLSSSPASGPRPLSALAHDPVQSKTRKPRLAKEKASAAQKPAVEQKDKDSGEDSDSTVAQESLTPVIRLHQLYQGLGHGLRGVYDADYARGLNPGIMHLVSTKLDFSSRDSWDAKLHEKIGFTYSNDGRSVHDTDNILSQLQPNEDDQKTRIFPKNRCMRNDEICAMRRGNYQCRTEKRTKLHIPTAEELRGNYIACKMTEPVINETAHSLSSAVDQRRVEYAYGASKKPEHKCAASTNEDSEGHEPQKSAASFDQQIAAEVQQQVHSGPRFRSFHNRETTTLDYDLAPRPTARGYMEAHKNVTECTHELSQLERHDTQGPLQSNPKYYSPEVRRSSQQEEHNDNFGPGTTPSEEQRESDCSNIYTRSTSRESSRVPVKPADYQPVSYAQSDQLQSTYPQVELTNCTDYGLKSQSIAAAQNFEWQQESEPSPQSQQTYKVYPKNNQSPRSNLLSKVKAAQDDNSSSATSRFASSSYSPESLPNTMVPMNGDMQVRFQSTKAGPYATLSSSIGDLRTRKEKKALSKSLEPTDAYKLQAQQSPVVLSSPQPLLIISDLNGTLIFRKAGKTVFTPRPSMSSFLQNLFTDRSIYTTRPQPGHRFMIWTSAMPRTLHKIAPTLLNAEERNVCVALWGRDKFGLSALDYRKKVQVYKRLEKVWSDMTIQATHPHHAQGKCWDQTNTLLIDDSALKASTQPYNHIAIPELTAKSLKIEQGSKHGSHDTAVLKQVEAYIEEASYHQDVSAFCRASPFVIDGEWARKVHFKRQGTAEPEQEF